MIASLKKARERFHLLHAPLGAAQSKLQAFLETQLDAHGRVRSYGTRTDPSKQLKNKLGQANTIPGGFLTLSVETRAIHDRAVKTLVEDWVSNLGWPKTVACVGIVHPADAGWKLATIVEWTKSPFPEFVRDRLFPDVVVVPANSSPAAGFDHHAADAQASATTYGARIVRVGAKLLVRQAHYHEAAPNEFLAERLVNADDDANIANAVRDAILGRL